MYAASIENSIRDILLTPLGSRVMLPEYGSRLFELVDKRVNDEFRADLTAYVVEAIEKWEKRVRVEEVRLKSFTNNKLVFSIVLDSGIEIEVAS
ncbi:MAG: GPW/gp25 family protein [Campylobacteraceae bacterium]